MVEAGNVHWNLTELKQDWKNRWGGVQRGIVLALMLP